MTTSTHSRQWWEGGRFGPRYVEGDDSYEDSLAPPPTLEPRTEIEVDGIIRLLALDRNARVLDCPCGHGRHALGLARRGMRVVGVGIDGEGLAVARQHGCPRAEFVTSDMRQLAFAEEFDAVVTMFHSFGVFASDEENLQVLRRFHRALVPGGRILMRAEVSIPRLASGKHGLEEGSLRGGKRSHVEEILDAVHGRVNGTWRLLDAHGCEEVLTPCPVGVYTFDELAGWCHAVGFRRVTGYGQWDGAPLTDASDDMMVVAEK